MKSKISTAPGDLEALRAFVNTVDLEKPAADRLADAAAATEWLRRSHLLAPHDTIDQAEVESILALREAFRHALLAHTGDADRDESWGMLGAFADLAELSVRCGEQPDVIELIAEGRGAQYVAGRLFSIMYDAIRLNQWPRLKACRKGSCLFAFYDHSKNGSGVWCDMAVCGNRLKAQRRRQRAGASPQPA